MGLLLLLDLLAFAEEKDCNNRDGGSFGTEGRAATAINVVLEPVSVGVDGGVI
jgi:hypothetical protein